MPSPLKKSQKNKEDINQQLHDTIYKKVTKENHKYASPQKGDGTIKKCIELFKQEADPNVLSELEKSLSKQIKLEKLPEKKEEYQKHYKYYIEDFLPALKTGVMELEVKPSVSNNEIEQLQRSPTRRAQILQIISEITKKSSNKDSKIEEQPISSIKKEIPVSSTGMTENNVESPTKEEVCASDSDSGVSSRKPSEESLESPVSSRRSSLILVTSTSSEESLNSTLNSVEEDNGLQPEDEGETKLAHLTKTRAKGPSGRRSPSKYNKKIEDQMQPEQVVKEELKLNSEKSGSTLPGKEELKLEEQKKEAVLSEQSAPDNNNDKEVLSKKQPNNRNFRIALATGCALSAIGCLIAGVVTLGMVGAGLFAMSVVLAIAAAVTRYLTPPPSELTSTNLSRPVDDKELTAL